MNCKNVQSRLSAYVDRELVGEEMQELRDHLSGCTSCQREETEFRMLKSFLGGVNPVQPPSDFEDRLIKNVLGSAKVYQLDPKRRPSYMLAAVAAAAAMVATLLILPSMRVPQRVPGNSVSPTSSDYAIEINRDQLYEASSDPLSGGHLVSPAVYGR